MHSTPQCIKLPLAAGAVAERGIQEYLHQNLEPNSGRLEDCLKHADAPDLAFISDTGPP